MPKGHAFETQGVTAFSFFNNIAIPATASLLVITVTNINSVSTHRLINSQILVFYIAYFRSIEQLQLQIVYFW